MKVASVTVMAMTQGFARGRHVSWNDSVLAADARADPHFCCGFFDRRGMYLLSSEKARHGAGVSKVPVQIGLF
jgi:hypothetical protein